jgi:hypothetical protein
VLAGAAVIFLCVALYRKNRALDEANASRAALTAQLEATTLRIKDLTAQSDALQGRLTALTGRMETISTKADGKLADKNRTPSTTRRTNQ